MQVGFLLGILGLWYLATNRWGVNRLLLPNPVAVFSARPGTIKKIIRVDEPHPRKPEFVTSEKFAALRNELYALLHDEIRKTVAESARASEGS